MRRAIFLFTVLLATSEATARELELSGGGGSVLVASSSIDAVSASPVIPLGGVGLALELSAWWLELRWEHGSTSARDFQALDASFALDQLTAGVRWPKQLRPWLAAYARASVGAAHGRLGFGSAADGAWGLVAAAAAGLEAHAFGAFHVRVEAGLLLASDLPFAARPADGALPVLAAPLGSINPSGLTFRAELVVRF
jgi:hypothetical protein